MQSKGTKGKVGAFGEFLKEIRLKRKLGTNQLAKLAGVSPAAISKFETGARRNPDIMILMKIAKPLKISLDELLKIAYPTAPEKLATVKKFMASDRKGPYQYSALNEIKKKPMPKVVAYLMKKIDEGKISLITQEILFYMIKGVVEREEEISD